MLYASAVNCKWPRSQARDPCQGLAMLFNLSAPSVQLSTLGSVLLQVVFGKATPCWSLHLDFRGEQREAVNQTMVCQQAFEGSWVEEKDGIIGSLTPEWWLRNPRKSNSGWTVLPSLHTKVYLWVKPESLGFQVKSKQQTNTFSIGQN